MELGLSLSHWGAQPRNDLAVVLAAEEYGYSTVWAAEGWGSDVVTVLSWLGARTTTIKLGAAIMQMHARTPAMTAMTAITLNELSQGRFILGLGVSGPQVVEGWHGVAYGKPLARSREYLAIIRKIVARKEPLVHTGDQYQIPYQGHDATGLGKPLKIITHPRHPLDIYLAAIGPRNVALAAEIADGWMPALYSPDKEATANQLETGFAASLEPNKRDRFAICPTVEAKVDEDLDAARDAMRPQLALYIGGMGAKGRNFYHNLATRYGYGAAADEVQDLYLAGDRMAATAAVPDELIDEVSLAGPRGHIADRLASWKQSGVSMLNIAPADHATLRIIAEIVHH